MLESHKKELVSVFQNKTSEENAQNTPFLQAPEVHVYQGTSNMSSTSLKQTDVIIPGVVLSALDPLIDPARAAIDTSTAETTIVDRGTRNVSR